MRLLVGSVDYAPEELHAQTPITVDLLRKIPGPDRPDYWLGKCERPVRWIDENVERTITHVVVAARWVGTAIEPRVENLPIGIAYVTNEAQLDAPTFDFQNARYVAIGTANEVEGGNKPKPLLHVIAGNIARAFGVGGES